VRDVALRSAPILSRALELAIDTVDDLEDATDLEAEIGLPPPA
jgi:hypothetical protein